METPKHTPGPWAVDSDTGHDYVLAPPLDENEGGATIICRMGLESDANAEYIVRACNNHDDLLEALRSIVVDADRLIAETPRHALSQPYTVLLDQARAAIAKATE